MPGAHDEGYDARRLALQPKRSRLPTKRFEARKESQRMTETDNKTRYGRIAVILIALAIVIAAFVSFIAMNNERIYEQNTKYLQGSTEQSARRISEWMTDSQTEIKLLSSMYESTLASVDEISAAGIEQLANYTKFDYTTISLSDGLTIDDQGPGGRRERSRILRAGAWKASRASARSRIRCSTTTSPSFSTRRFTSRTRWLASFAARIGKIPWRSSCAPIFSTSRPTPTCSIATAT